MKTAEVSYKIHDLIAARWSPYAFSAAQLEPEVLGSLFEAARWAPSCFNAQPWRFLAAQKSADPAGFERLAACLVEGNAWAKAAPLLLLTVAELSFAHNGKPNRHAQHDVGLAMENLVLQAQSLGLAVHQMGGFDAAKATESLSIPKGFEAMAMVAVGYPGEAEQLPEGLQDRQRKPRERRPLESFVYGAGWELRSPLG